MSGPLFTRDELADHLGKPVTDAAADSVERVVWGWLKPVLGLSDRPDQVPDEVFSWAIELGAIAHENPAGLARYELGSEMMMFSVERRGQILTEASENGVGGHTQGSPRGSFPTASTYPDAADSRRWRNW